MLERAEVLKLDDIYSYWRIDKEDEAEQEDEEAGQKKAIDDSDDSDDSGWGFTDDQMIQLALFEDPQLEERRIRLQNAKTDYGERLQKSLDNHIRNAQREAQRDPEA